MRAVLIALLLTGCAQPTRIFVPVELPLPPAPVLPTVKAAELECLPDDVVDRIEARDDLRHQYQEELRAVIRSTHTQ